MTIHTEQGFILTAIGVIPGIAVSIGCMTENGPRKSLGFAKAVCYWFCCPTKWYNPRSVVGHNRDIDIRPLALKTLKTTCFGGL